MQGVVISSTAALQIDLLSGARPPLDADSSNLSGSLSQDESQSAADIMMSAIGHIS
jgi:hypothetical protein